MGKSEVSGRAIRKLAGSVQGNPSSKVTLHVEDLDPINTRFLGPTRVCIANGISIGSTVFAQLTHLPNTQNSSIGIRGFV